MRKRFIQFFQEYFRSCVDFSLLERIEKLENRCHFLENEIISIDAKADYCLRVLKHYEDGLIK